MTQRWMRTSAWSVAVLMVVLGSVGTARSQQPASAPKPVILLKLDLVLARYLVDKKTSSLPFTLLVNAAPPPSPSGRGASIRMGVDLPVGIASSKTDNSTARTSMEYRSVGTSIDCNNVSQLDDGRFSFDLTIQDSAILTADQDPKTALKGADPMAFRTFTSSNRLTLRDGQTLQFMMATDKMTGETLKVEVTISVAR